MTCDMVVLGLGYVGLPLAQQAVRAGLAVLGFDVRPDVVAGLAAGRSHVDDLSDDDVAAMLAGGFVPTVDESLIATAGTAVICVPASSAKTCVSAALPAPSSRLAPVRGLCQVEPNHFVESPGGGHPCTFDGLKA